MKYIVSLIVVGLLLICQPAMGMDLQSAKAQGLVGETVTGYLGAVKSSPEVQKLVNDINAKRKQHYKKISTRNKTPLSSVEKLAGKKAMEKTLPGQFIQVNGAWKKK